MLKLPDEVRGRLLGFRRGMAYQDLLDIGAQLCQKAELSLFELDRAHGATSEQILSGQEQCRAQRIFLQNLLAEIELQCNALIAEQTAKAPPTNEAVLGMDAEREAADMLGLIPSEESQI